MKEITVVCDRCAKVIQGGIDDFPLDKSIKVIKGFYDVTDSYWSQFARWEEEIVCDECIHSSPEYKKINKHES